METKTEKTTAALAHLSALSQYFIPFGNFIFPIIIWSSKKDKSEFIDYHGKQVINFQLSLLLYSIIFALIAVPTFATVVFSSMDWNEILNNQDVIFEKINMADNINLITTGIVAVLLIILLKIAEFFLIIIGAISASNGEKYKYPITINFIK